MAFAEMRAAWQRTANRCIVQEDARRAPKLACCPSAPPSVKEVDAAPPGAADPQDALFTSSVPLNQNSCSNLSPNSRWWLQRGPNYGHQRGLTGEQLNSLEKEMETLGVHEESGFEVIGLNYPNTYSDVCIEKLIDAECLPEAHFKIFETCSNNDVQSQRQELKNEVTGESGSLGNASLTGSTDPKQSNKSSFDPCDPWIGPEPEKTEPWWRTADSSELASLLSQRSLDHIVNCDLPLPQKAPIRRVSFVNQQCSNHDGTHASLLGQKLATGVHPNLSIDAQVKLSTGGICQKQLISHEGHIRAGGDTLSDGTSHKAMPERHLPENDPSRAQLLEALRHSQTRAREAEKAANQAFAEKEHIVSLVFRQASQLFAYKQWFQLLQLENLYFQIKNNKSQTLSSLFPAMLPWMPPKTRKPRKSWHKPARGRRVRHGHRPRSDIGRYGIVFALGLSLVGAGLLLGWTVGWIFSIF